MNTPEQQAETLLQVAQQNQQLPIIATDSAALILDESSMKQMEALAVIMAKGRATVPQHLQGNQGDCMAVIMQAVQWKMNPFAVAQKTHVVNGTLGYEAQLVNAVINTMAPTKDRIHYEWFGPWENVIGKFEIRKVPEKGKYGDKDYKKAHEYRVPGWSMKDEDGLGVRVWATLKGEDEPRVLELLLSQASVRNSPLWASDPKQQLAYLAVKRWARLYTPDVILGVYTPDEFEQPPMKDITPAPASNAKPADVAARRKGSQQTGPSEKLLKSARDAADKGRTAFADFWRDIKGVDRNALRDELADLQERVEKAEKSIVDAPNTSSTAGATVDDEFVRDMDRASGASTTDYTPE